jgi:hypothetical protein
MLTQNSTPTRLAVSPNVRQAQKLKYYLQETQAVPRTNVETSYQTLPQLRLAGSAFSSTTHRYSLNNVHLASNARAQFGDVYCNVPATPRDPWLDKRKPFGIYFDLSTVYGNGRHAVPGDSSRKLLQYRYTKRKHVDDLLDDCQPLPTLLTRA